MSPELTPAASPRSGTSDDAELQIVRPNSIVGAVGLAFGQTLNAFSGYPAMILTMILFLVAMALAAWFWLQIGELRHREMMRLIDVCPYVQLGPGVALPSPAPPN